MGSDIGIQGAKFILSDIHGEIKNIRDFGISTICEINDFVNSFDEIIDKVSNYSIIDGIFVELFKKAKLFDICLEHLKRSENLSARSLNICIENKLNDLQLSNKNPLLSYFLKE
jgi:formyltetrahydrofolate synthetase